MIKKSVFILILFVVSCLTLNSLFLNPIHAQDCSDAEACKKLIEEYESKLTGIRAQKNTLSSQIQYFDTQIYITTAKIRETELKIKQTEEEIVSLGEKIDGLNTSLDYLGKILIKKIVEGYKRKETTIINLIVDSNNAIALSNQLKYIQIAQDNDRRIAFQVQTAKNNYEEQKTLREKKKIELATLKNTLDSQKSALDTQKAVKQKLLVDTNNDENNYQELLSKAQAQSRAFSSFVTNSGAYGIISANSLGSGSDGAYYSQQDERWGRKTIGYSSETIQNVGCLLTSITMFAKKNGQNVTPADTASDISRFYGNTAWMNLPWVGVAGKSYHPISSTSEMKNELNSGNYVIVGVYKTSCYNGGDHYVLLTKVDGDDYKMHDPILGPDKNFKGDGHYSTICSMATFK